MKWYGIVSSHIIRYGIVLHYMVLYHIISFRIIWYRIILYGIVSYGMAWYRIMWYRILSYCIVWYGMVSYGIALYHIVSYGIVSYCPINSSNDRQKTWQQVWELSSSLKGSEPPILTSYYRKSLADTFDWLLYICIDCWASLLVLTIHINLKQMWLFYWSGYKPSL